MTFDDIRNLTPGTLIATSDMTYWLVLDSNNNCYDLTPGTLANLFTGAIADCSSLTPPLTEVFPHEIMW